MLVYGALKDDPLAVQHDFMIVRALKGGGKDILPTLCGREGYGSDKSGPRCPQCESLKLRRRVFMVENGEVTKFPKERYWELCYRGTLRERLWARKTVQFATVYTACLKNRPIRVMRIDYMAHKFDGNGERINPLRHKALWWNWQPTKEEENKVRACALRGSGFKVLTT